MLKHKVLQRKDCNLCLIRLIWSLSYSLLEEKADLTNVSSLKNSNNFQNLLQFKKKKNQKWKIFYFTENHFSSF